jgi:hypothetical protein
VSWDTEHLQASATWFNPWPIKYLLPVEKWFPLYWPNETWEITALDELGNRVAPRPPDGTIGPWWKMLPKDQWPLEAPWEPKVFGAWPASKISMPEDLENWPPFGFIKVETPSDYSGIWPAKQASYMNMKIHMRPDLGPIHHMRIMTRNTPMGQKFYMIDKNWDHAEYNYQEYREALKQRKMEKFLQMLAEEIIKTKGEPKPSKDLFV